jgi:hypothetical protein
MNLMMLRNAGRYFFEALLIFLSVYGAFLLEAKRSEDFERKALLGELRTMLTDLHLDSLRMAKQYYKDNALSDQIQETIAADSFFLAVVRAGLLQYEDSAYRLFQAGQLFIQYNPDALTTWDTEYSTYAAIRSNHTYLMHTDTTVRWIDSYHREREDLINNVSDLDTWRDDMYRELMGQFDLGGFIAPELRGSILRHPLVIGTIERNFWGLKAMRFQLQFLMEYVPEISITIEKEIQAQEEKIG